MKYYACFLLVVSGIMSCTRDAPCGGVVLENRETIVRAGDQVVIRWCPAKEDLPVVVTLENYLDPGAPTECLLIPEHHFLGGHGVTHDDGEDRYYIPWRYADEGRVLYRGAIGTGTFAIRVAYAQYDSAIHVWRQGTVFARSSRYFAIASSLYPDGCRDSLGESATTGQPCR